MKPKPGAWPLPINALCVWVVAGLLVVASALACSSGGESTGGAYGEEDAVAIDGDATTVVMNNLRFEPRAIRVKPGTVVTWLNEEPIVHNVTSIDSAFRSEDEMPEGDRFAFQFESTGTFRYQCTFHPPDMLGVVIVE